MASSDYEFTLDPVDVPPVETAFRRIVTPQPPAGTGELTRRLRAIEPLSMSGELPVTWDSAVGFQVSDPYGNRWLDFSSGIFVANAGHAPPHIRDSIAEMVGRPLLHSYMFVTEVRAGLIDALVEATPEQLDTVLLLTTGSEAIEAAIKMARLRGLRSRPDKLGIVSLTFGFHGKTMGAQTAGGRASDKRWIGQLDPNMFQIPVPYSPVCPWDHGDSDCDASCFERGMAALEVDPDTIAAFIVEPYQGWSAAFLPDSYVEAMRRFADDHDALLIFDEVQAGIGRTGRLLAHEHFGVAADLVVCAKGLSSSLPISAVIGRREIVDSDGSLNSTHGGNPVCCAAALANLELITGEDLIGAAERSGAIFLEELERLQRNRQPHVARIEGRGMVWAIHLVDPETGELDGVLGDMVIEQAMRKGVLCVRTGTGTVKIGPPLSMPEEAVREGIAVLGDAIDEALAARNGASG
jgi:4-aminobutyrate aminotransferase-like enzyme